MKKPCYFFLIPLLIFNSITYAQDDTSNFYESDLFGGAVDEITILPVVDNRMSKHLDSKLGFEPDFANELRAKVSGEMIAIKGFKIRNVDNYGGHSSVSNRDMQNPGKNWVRKLGPENSLFNLVLVMSDTKKIPQGRFPGEIKLSAYIFNKKDGSMVWKNSQVVEITDNGKTAGFMHDYQDIVYALRVGVPRLMGQIPEIK